MRTIQYTQLVDEAIYDGRLNTDAFHGNERIELINALLDQWGYETEAAQQVVDLVERLAPATDNIVTERLPDDSSGNNVYIPKHPRVCNECCLQTTKVLCPRCGGQTDLDPYRS